MIEGTKKEVCWKGLPTSTSCKGWRLHCRVTAPVSGSKSVDQDIKDTTKQTAEEAKHQSRGVLGSISDGFKYAGEMCVFPPFSSHAQLGQHPCNVVLVAIAATCKRKVAEQIMES